MNIVQGIYPIKMKIVVGYVDANQAERARDVAIRCSKESILEVRLTRTVKTIEELWGQAQQQGYPWLVFVWKQNKIQVIPVHHAGGDHTFRHVKQIRDYLVRGLIPGQVKKEEAAPFFIELPVELLGGEEEKKDL